MTKLILILALLFGSVRAFASAPICLATDVQSGPASGGEGGNGAYFDIYGLNFGASQGASTVTVNGTTVAQYLYWGTDPTGDYQKIGVQVASGTTTGAIVVTTSGGTCSNLSFTIRSGHIYFIGSAVDTSSPTSCATMEAANSYASPWGLTNVASTAEGSYNYLTMRTPESYYNCISDTDTLVFLNGMSYPYFDGAGWHSSLTMDDATATSTSFKTLVGRPGGTATIGGNLYYTMNGAKNKQSNVSYTVIANLTFIGSYNSTLAGNADSGLDPYNNDRIVGNIIECPPCSGSSSALGGGANTETLFNLITQVGTDTTIDPAGTNKQYHAVYFAANNFEFAWNRIYNTAAYNGFQIHEDSFSGFYNFAIHDNDIADVNGSGINLSAIDPSLGYVQVYNNVIHHTGVSVASDGTSGDPHSCIAVKGFGTSTGTGTVQIYNNTMYDCSSYLNTENTAADCGVLLYNNQPSVTTNMVNNVMYQPGYTNTGTQNPYLCAGGGTLGPLTGSHNLFYSATTPGSTTPAATIGTIANPLYTSASNGSWTNYKLQSGSPAIGAGLQVGPVQSLGSSNTHLTWDFQQAIRPTTQDMGALEYVAPTTTPTTGSLFFSKILTDMTALQTAINALPASLKVAMTNLTAGINAVPCKTQ